MATVAPLDTAPPRREAWRLGLVNAARETQNYHDPTTGETALAQRVGVTYSPPFPAEGTGDRTFDPCDADGSNITYPGSTADQLAFAPWGIAQVAECPTLGADPASVLLDTRSVLAERTSHLIEQVLWTGSLDVGTDLATLATAEGTNNVALTDGPALIDGSTAHDLTVALGLINEYVDGVLGGYRAWIHAETEVTPFVGFYGQGQRTSARSVEQFLGDHRFVFGTGYDGSAPDGESVAAGETWLIVTSPVRVIAGQITPSPTTDPVDYIDRDRNRVRVVANRLVLAEWDLQLHAAIKVCLPAPGPACS